MVMFSIGTAARVEAETAENLDVNLPAGTMNGQPDRIDLLNVAIGF